MQTLITSDDEHWLAVEGNFSRCSGCREADVDGITLRSARGGTTLCRTCVETLMDLKERAEQGMY